MNKKELKKHIEGLPYSASLIVDTIKINRNGLLKLIEQLDEPQKVTVPQFVADYIKEAKYYEWDLDDVFDHIAEESEGSEISEWFHTLGNVDVFARAWLDGYEVEKETLYTIRFKNTRKETRYLKYDRVVKDWYFGVKQYSKDTKIYHTQKELENAGFGWVFDCPGIEIEEVQDDSKI